MNKTELQTILISWIATRRLIIEIILTVIALLCYFLVHAGVLELFFLVIPMTTLAAFYFISAFFPPAAEKISVIICSKVIGISSAAGMIGILFSLLGLEGKAQMLIAVMTILPATLFLFVDYLASRRGDSIVLIVRGVVLAFLCFYFFNLLPPEIA